MDFFNSLPEDIFIEILSYLNVKDMLKASVVCKGWYQMFGQSKEFIQNVTVKYTNDSRYYDLDALLNSGREYQNFSIKFHRGLPKETEVNIRMILKRFSRSIIKLETFHDVQRVCELPKLKELKFIDFSLNFHWGYKNCLFQNGLIATCLNVSRLEIKCSTLIDNNLKILQETIQNMQNLKELALDHFSFLKSIKPEDCKFKLEKFESGPYTSAADIFDFLKHHQSTLKCIKVMRLYPKDIPFIFLEFPKLHTLHFYVVFSDKNLHELNFPENSTVKDVIIVGSYYYQEEQDKIAEIITKLKNVQHIRLNELHSQYINAFFACKSLVSVKYNNLGDDLTEDQKDYINNNEKIKFILAPLTY